MRFLAALVFLSLFACEDLTSTSLNANQNVLGTIAGSVFHGEAAPEDAFVVALGSFDADTGFTIEAVVGIETSQLPYAYEFQGLERGIDYRLVAIDADLRDYPFAVDEFVAATVDTVQIPLSEERMDGINLAL